MWRARRRCPASTATRRSSSATCSTTARDLGAEVLATGHYVAAPRAAGRRPRALPRARRRARPELFPVRHHARAARLPALPARRHAQGGDARARARASAWRSPTSPTARTSASCRPGRYTDVIERLQARARPSRATSSISTAACSAAMTASSITRSASGAGSASPPAQPLYVVRLERRRAASSSARARRCARSRMRAARGQLARRRHASTMRCAPAGTRCSSRCARPGRRSRPGCAADGDGVEVELLDGEDGVSPGQACVFYDAADGQARVLGGGFIQSAVAATRPVDARGSAPSAAAVACRAASLASTVRRGELTDGGDGGRTRQRHGREGLCALGAGLRSRLRRGVRRRPQGLDRGGRARRRAHPRRRRRHRHLAARLCAARNRLVGVDYLASRCCARRRSASPSTSSPMSRRWR